MEIQSSSKYFSLNKARLVLKNVSGFVMEPVSSGSVAPSSGHMTPASSDSLGCPSVVLTCHALMLF